MERVTVDAAEEVLGFPLADAKSAGPRLLAETVKRVVRWAWTDPGARWEEPEPLLAERWGRKPVTRSSTAPPDPVDSAVQYGYVDRESPTPIIGLYYAAPAMATEVESPVGPAGSTLNGVNMWVKGRDGTPILLAYDILGLSPARSEWVLMRMMCPEGPPDAPTRVRTWHFDELRSRAPTLVSESYTYDEMGRVATVSSGLRGGDGEVEGRVVFDVEYAGESRSPAVIRYVERDADDTQSDAGVAYRRSEPGEIRRARRVVERRLPELIQAWTDRVGADEPVYALGILYVSAQESILPSLGLGLERERQRWISAHGSGGAIDLIWNPAEYSIFDPIPDELESDVEFADASAILAQEWQSTDNDDALRKLMVSTARRLAKVDWASRLSVAASFAVFAVDDELVDLDANLRRLVGKRDRLALEGRSR